MEGQHANRDPLIVKCQAGHPEKLFCLLSANPTIKNPVSRQGNGHFFNRA